MSEWLCKGKAGGEREVYKKAGVEGVVYEKCEVNKWCTEKRELCESGVHKMWEVSGW